MKVLMTTDAVGGVWDYSLTLAKALQAHDVKVVLAVLGPGPDADQRARAEALPNVRVEQAPYRLEWMPQADGDVAASGDWLLVLEARHGPDVVHLNGYAHALLPFRAPRLVVAHSCVCGWWQAVHHASPDPVYATYMARVSRALAAADLIVAPTDAITSDLHGHHGPLTRPVQRIWNGIEVNGHRARPKDETVLWVGRVWDEAKNIRTLDAAAKDLPWPVVAIGDDRHPDGGHAPKLDNVRLAGRVPQERLVQAYGRAPIFVSTARYEPFGLAPLQAALSGAALVLSDIPTLREVWGEAALYAHPSDPSAYQRALLSLIRDPLRLKHRQEAARTRALRYDAAPMASAYAEAYRSLVEPNTTRSLEDPPCAS